MLNAVPSTCTITIFEGPDGAGKSTAAEEYAKRTGALYVHFDALYGVKNIHKYFMEAMAPALLGYQSVVLDRCWHSGPIYDLVFRNLEEHEQRQTQEICTLLDRAASFCRGIYVRCRPDVEVCINNWKSRLGDELVKSEQKMRAIHELYGDNDRNIMLPIVEYDYTEEPTTSAYKDSIEWLGNKIAEERADVYNKRQPRVYVVVSSSMEKTDVDTMLDVPGVRFHPNSNEFKLAQDLGPYSVFDDDPVPEELVTYLPVNGNFKHFFKTFGKHAPRQYIVAIGEKANEAVHAFVNSITPEDAVVMPNIDVAFLLDTLADSVMRGKRNMPPMSDMITSKWYDLVKNTSESQNNHGDAAPKCKTVVLTEDEVAGLSAEEFVKYVVGKLNG